MAANRTEQPRVTTIGLARGIIDDVEALARTEVRLAKAETKANALKFARPFALFAVAGVLASGALLALLASAIAFLATVMGVGLAALLVAVVVAAAAGVIVLSASASLKRAKMMPVRTERSVARDIETLRGDA
ncbi:MAG: phage holin family protein [Sphingomonadaceae bacterium]|nr:phage holin family protein [Sphingomonadaceae bacterium]